MVCSCSFFLVEPPYTNHNYIGDPVLRLIEGYGQPLGEVLLTINVNDNQDDCAQCWSMTLRTSQSASSSLQRRDASKLPLALDK
ncbi:hypothetical protein EON65_39425 [archaeon]|nr:MAG: hypothetical protein EON65_39425 [archaeon]